MELLRICGMWELMSSFEFESRAISHSQIYLSFLASDWRDSHAYARCDLPLISSRDVFMM